MLIEIAAKSDTIRCKKVDSLNVNLQECIQHVSRDLATVEQKLYVNHSKI